MKKHLTIFLFITLFICGMSQNLPTAQLPAPGKFSLTYLNSLSKKNILYGALPPNYNGKVLVFNHGYVASTETLLLLGNNMYEKAYNAGYKTAFVATTRGKGDWDNGHILARALNQISQFYNTRSLDLIVHSNGGKASEVALFYYGKRDLVNKVITLGTPFRGTQAADIGVRPLMGWVLKLIGLGDGAKLSTTYYCDGYFRPFFDYHPLNQPEKYYNFGAWGYASIRGIYSPVMFVTGGVMMLAGSGPNDGITPFYSSTRPGGLQLSPLGDSRGNYNHMDIMYGQVSWDKIIYPVLTGKVKRMQSLNTESQFETSSSYQVTSNYQYLSSVDNEQAIFGADTKNARIEVIREDNSADVQIMNAVSSQKLTTIKALKRQSMGEGTLEQHTSVSELKAIPSRLSIAANTEYAAYVTDNVDKPMNYTLHKDNEKTLVEITFPNLSLEELNRLELTAKIRRVTDVYGKETGEIKEREIKLKREGSKFISEVGTSNVSGVYSLYVNAEIPQEYRRNIISGFVLETDGTESGVNNELLAVKKNFKLSGNPVNISTALQIPTDLRSDLQCRVFAANGSLVTTFEIKNDKVSDILPIGTFLSNLESGYYILNLKSEKYNETIKFLK